VIFFSTWFPINQNATLAHKKLLFFFCYLEYLSFVENRSPKTI